MKNIDLRINKARKAIFSLLGPAYNYKCFMSPVVKLHLSRTYMNPVLRSGLSTFVIRKTTLLPLNIFHTKIIKSLLKLIDRTPTPAIHFLTGELPMERKIHRDMFILF